MKSSSPNQNFSLTSIFCSTFGHRYKKSKKITNHISEYKCKTCGQEVTNAISGGIEILTFKNRKVNACLSDFFQKKLQQTTSH
jgi:transposase-like protein